jgi:hypothetical protein
MQVTDAITMVLAERPLAAESLIHSCNWPHGHTSVDAHETIRVYRRRGCRVFGWPDGASTQRYQGASTDRLATLGVRSCTQRNLDVP